MDVNLGILNLNATQTYFCLLRRAVRLVKPQDGTQLKKKKKGEFCGFHREGQRWGDDELQTGARTDLSDLLKDPSAGWVLADEEA